MTGQTDAAEVALPLALFRRKYGREPVPESFDQSRLTDCAKTLALIEPELAADRAAQRRLGAEAVVAVLPAECWVTRTVGIRCTDFIGGRLGSAEFTEEMCCLPCRARAAAQQVGGER